MRSRVTLNSEKRVSQVIIDRHGMAWHNCVHAKHNHKKFSYRPIGSWLRRLVELSLSAFSFFFLS